MDKKEYIEREAVLKISPFTKYGGDTSQYTEGYLDCAEEAREAIRNVPTADVVEVVRCKDCKMWNRNHISCEGLARCMTGEGGIRYRSRNDFCSYGAKMDGKGGSNE